MDGIYIRETGSDIAEKLHGPYGDLSDALDAFERLRKREPRHNFTILGNGQETPITTLGS